jgi:hypothetical protein
MQALSDYSKLLCVHFFKSVEVCCKAARQSGRGPIHPLTQRMGIAGLFVFFCLFRISYRDHEQVCRVGDHHRPSLLA